MGHAYYWRFRYAGPDGQLQTPDDVRIGRELHLPSDTDVLLLVRSNDFVYSFFVPELGLRRIAVPELTYKLEFRTSRVGRYSIETEPGCGVRLFHEGPMGQLIVESPGDFAAWLRAFGR